MTGKRCWWARVSTVAVIAATITQQGWVPPVLADGPGVGPETVITLGDSYISGEGGRWAGNVDDNDDYKYADMLGPSAYWDGDNRETIPRCHRSSSAEAHIGNGVRSINLACSGALTSTHWDEERFKPGIDFYDDGEGNIGQAELLRIEATRNNVKWVVLSIGGNNFGFGSVIAACIEAYITEAAYPGITDEEDEDHCSTMAAVTARTTPANRLAQTNAILNAIFNIARAMQRAGYLQSQYTILVQDYPSPLPLSSNFRYEEGDLDRQSVGGCGFWDEDADWLTGTFLPAVNNAVAGAVTLTKPYLSNVREMKLSTAFTQRELCARGLRLLRYTCAPLIDGTVKCSGFLDKNQADKLEWITQARAFVGESPFYVQEGAHPNYWGQLALRNCLRQALTNTVSVGGVCTRMGARSGLNTRGEPDMNFKPVRPLISTRLHLLLPSEPISVALGGEHSCALLADETVKCWGRNTRGQLGNSTLRNTRTPISVVGGGMAAISAGLEHTCSVTTSNFPVRLPRAYCWGKNNMGQLGNGTLEHSNVPTEVMGLGIVLSISAGKQHTCAPLIDGTVKCWGKNTGGQLGNNTTTGSSIPVQVSGLTGVSAVAAGGEHTCALLTGGTVKCWGKNISGQLGNNLSNDSSIPVQVYGLTGVSALVAGSKHTCALLTTKTVKCWGNNTLGQLGNYGPTSAIPVQVSGLTGVSAVAAGGEHTCALLTDGTVKCWGKNISGQLGNNTTTGSQVPVQVYELADVSAVAAGGEHTCALLTNGAVKCWGKNNFAQLGTNSFFL